MKKHLATLEALFQPADLIEVRAFNPKPYYGFFNDFNVAAKEISRIDKQPGWKAIYVTLNAVNPSLINSDKVKRRLNTKLDLAGSGWTTSDSDIERRSNILIDFDPVRESGISATNEEKALSHDKMIEVKAFLSTQKWPEPIVCDSGNGWHLLYACDLPNDDESKDLILMLLTGLATQFKADYDKKKNQKVKVDIDRKVFNAGRITKAYGTYTRKGSKTKERPHRRSELVSVPEQREIVSQEILISTVKGLEQPSKEVKKSRAKKGKGSKANKPISTAEFNEKLIRLKQWVESLGLDITKEGSTKDFSYRFEFQTCPWNKSHTDRAAWAGLLTSGAFAAGCQHNGCAGNEWNQFRALVDPAYDLWNLPNCMNDSFNSELLTEALKGDFLYAADIATWYEWNHKSRWQPSKEGDHPITRIAKGLGEWWADQADEVKRLQFTKDEKSEDFKQLKSLSKQVSSYTNKAKSWRNIQAATKLTKAAPNVSTSLDQFDINTGILGLHTNVIELKDGQVREAKKSDRISRGSDVAYDEKADCPRFKAFISEVFPEPELAAYVQRVFGYCLTGDVSEHAMFICHGHGRNGKSTLLELLRDLLGELATSVDPSTLLRTKDDTRTATPGIVAMRGRRVVIAQETKAGKALDTSVIKALTGGDTINARPLYGAPIEFKPQFKIFLATNHEPAVSENDTGIWRRIHLIPFSQTFDEPDLQLSVKLRAEFSGILNWALAGLKAWQEEGLSPPSIIQEATEAYRNEEDRIGRFLESLEEREDALLSGEAFYQGYRKWSEVNGTLPMNSTRFGRELSSKGLEKYRTRAGRFYKGYDFHSNSGYRRIPRV